MRTTFEVADADEAAQIRAGLEQPDVRAFVRIMGIFACLPTNRAKRRVLTYVMDRVDDPTFRYQSITPPDSHETDSDD